MCLGPQPTALQSRSAAVASSFPMPGLFRAGCVGRGPLAPYAFAVTDAGQLYRLHIATCAVDSCLTVHHGPCVSVATHGASVCVGCTGGVVRVFHGDTLAFLYSLPLPPATDAPHALATPRSPTRVPVDVPASPSLLGSPVGAGAGATAPELPAAVAVGLLGPEARRAVVVYSDRAMFVWDSDPRWGRGLQTSLRCTLLGPCHTCVLAPVGTDTRRAVLRVAVWARVRLRERTNSRACPWR